MGGLRFFSSVALVGGALIACSGGGGSTGSGAGDSSSFASQYCEIFSQCCGKAGYPTDGVQCRNFVDKSASGREYDAAKAEECLAGYRADSSRPDFCEKSTSIPACSEVYKKAGGGAAPGATCSDDDDCAPSAEGDVDCASYSSNGATTRICQVRVRAKEGETCIGTKDGSITSTSGAGGAPPPKIGICHTEDNLHCESAGTSTNGQTERKCARIQDVGGPCTSSSSFACVKTAYCNTTTKQCAARLPLDGDCGTSSGGFGSNVCQDKLSCDQATKKCVQGLADGAACERSDQCESKSCVNKKCEKSSGLEELGYLLICGPKAGG